MLINRIAAIAGRNSKISESSSRNNGPCQPGSEMSPRIRRIDPFPFHDKKGDGGHGKQADCPQPDMDQCQSDEDDDPYIKEEEPGRTLGFAPVGCLIINRGVHSWRNARPVLRLASSLLTSPSWISS